MASVDLLHVLLLDWALLNERLGLLPALEAFKAWLWVVLSAIACELQIASSIPIFQTFCWRKPDLPNQLL